MAEYVQKLTLFLAQLGREILQKDSHQVFQTTVQFSESDEPSQDFCCSEKPIKIHMLVLAPSLNTWHFSEKCEKAVLVNSFAILETPKHMRAFPGSVS